MAVFNPPVPEPADPNYLGYSKGADSNKALGALFKGTGDVIELGAKGLNMIQQADIEKKGYEGVDRIQNDYLSALKVAQNIMEGGSRTDGYDPPSDKPVFGQSPVKGTPLEILSTDPDARYPQAIEEAPRAIETLTAARADGKFSQTYYKMRLDSLLKSLRSQYPGQREYIDKVMNKATGIDMANAYLESVLSDLNSLAGNTRTQQEKERTWLLSKSEVPGMDTWIPEYMQGKRSFDSIVPLVAKFEGNQSIIKVLKAERENRQGDLVERAGNAEREANTRAYTTLNNRFTHVLSAGGIHTAKDLSELISDVMSGKRKINTEQAQQLGMALKAQENAVVAELEAQFNEGGKDSIASLVPEKIQGIIDRYRGMYTRAADAIYNEKWGIAGQAVRSVQARVDDAVHGVYNSPDKDLSRGAISIAVLKKMGVPEDKVNAFFGNLIGQGFDTKFGNWTKDQLTEIAAQPDYRTTALPKTIKESIEELKRKGAPVTMPRLFEPYIDLVEQIADPNTDPVMRKNIALGAFSEQGIGVLKHFANENQFFGKKDPVLGRNAIFKRWTHPDMVNGIFSTKDSDVIGKYMNWVKQEYASIFREDIIQLNEMQQEPDKKFFNVVWSDTDKKWDVRANFDAIKQDDLSQDKIVGSSGFRASLEQGRKHAQTLVNRLNDGLGAIQSVGKAAGLGDRDVEHYVLEQMIQAGWRMEEGNSTIRGLPDAMIRSLIHSQIQRQQKIDQRRQWGVTE